MNDKITYSILTWGPCVAKMKMTDAFHKVLMEEADASQTESQLYQHRLAGIIKKEYQLKDYTKVIANKLKNQIYPDKYFYLTTRSNSNYKNFMDSREQISSDMHPIGLHTLRFWGGHITFYGLDDYDGKNNSWKGPSPVKLRFFIQDTLRNEINEELKILTEHGDNMVDDAVGFMDEFMDDIRDHTNNEDKITQLLNSIKDVLCEGFLRKIYWKD